MMWKRYHYVLLLYDETKGYPATMVYWVYKTLLCCFHTTPLIITTYMYCPCIGSGCSWLNWLERRHRKCAVRKFTGIILAYSRNFYHLKYVIYIFSLLTRSMSSFPPK